jgi:hypothetical protein
MTPSNRPGILSGAVIGAMLMASLITVFYLAWRLAGLPFIEEAPPALSGASGLHSKSMMF